MDVPSSTPDGILMLHAIPQPVAQSAVEAMPLPEPVPASASQQPTLFCELPAATPPSCDPPAAVAKPRITRPERCQGEFRAESLDERLDADHPVRLVWSFVEQLDLSELFIQVKAVEGGVGRNATDFRVLFALLLWASIDGVGSAHEIDRLSRR